MHENYSTVVYSVLASCNSIIDHAKYTKAYIYTWLNKNLSHFCIIASIFMPNMDQYS